MPRLKKSPAFQWYPRDYLADPIVIAMTLEQEGAYRRLMDVCWLERGLPSDLGELWRLAKAPSRDRFTRRIWNVVGRKFYLKKGKFQHKRLDRERAKQAKYHRSMHLNGKKGGRPKKAAAFNQLSDSKAEESSSSAFASATAVNNKIKSTVAARRPVENLREPDEGTFGLYCTIAREARHTSIEQDRNDSIGNIAAIFKDLCAERHVAYDGETAARAIEAVLTSTARSVAH
jgi:uncharacterized protein YdaU (DUF1376 family)